jgi:hypothetical protein
VRNSGGFAAKMPQKPEESAPIYRSSAFNKAVFGAICAKNALKSNTPTIKGQRTGHQGGVGHRAGGATGHGVTDQAIEAIVGKGFFLIPAANV